MKLAVGALVFACLAPASHAEVLNISNEEFAALMKQGVPVVDLRTAPEWKQTGVVAGSQMITLYDEKGRADPVAWSSSVDLVADPAKPVVLICRSGNRSGKAAQMLDQKNPGRKIYNVREGINGWARAGLPVVSQAENIKRAGIQCGPIC